MAEERDGGFTYYRLDRRARRRGRRTRAALALARAASSTRGRRPTARADDARLQEVLRLRKENFDDARRPATGDARQLVPGRSWAAWSRALGLLLPPLEVADLGCGEGYLTIEAARWATRVIAVDRSRRRARRARAALARRRKRHERRLEARRAREAAARRRARSTSRCCRRRCITPAIPARAVAEARRILRPGGRVLVLDLREHDEDWVRDEARRSRGSASTTTELRAHARRAPGFATSRSASARAQAGDPFTVLIAAARSRAVERQSPIARTKEQRLVRADDTTTSRAIARSRCSRRASSSSTARWGR